MMCYCDDIFGWAEERERARRNAERARVAAKYYCMPLKLAKNQEVSEEPVVIGIKWHCARNTASPKKRKLAELGRFIERAKAKKAFTGPLMRSQSGTFGYYRCATRAGHPSFRRLREQAGKWERDSVPPRHKLCGTSV